MSIVHLKRVIRRLSRSDEVRVVSERNDFTKSRVIHARKVQPRSRLKTSARKCVNQIFVSRSTESTGSANCNCTLTAKLQTQGGTARICGFGRQQPVPLRSHIADRHQILPRASHLQRELIIFGIRQPVSVVERRRTPDPTKRCVKLCQRVVGRSAGWMTL